ncbi:hypothetical protein TBC1_112079 [Lentimicrobium saccharophilum]|uniref:Uncharacterized protein n=1 Tax=Lentimicrobium saccharophilum TaxID=1678841 RepID=A0A0S7C1K9_9BACT|nr:hypothetical protein TBC1_112079 [Lentimicrobium saccharophilum]
MVRPIPEREVQHLTDQSYLPLPGSPGKFNVLLYKSFQLNDFILANSADF